MLVGNFHPDTAQIFSGSVVPHPADIICPRYLTSFWKKWYFRSFNFKWCCQRQPCTIAKHCRCCWNEAEKMTVVQVQRERLEALVSEDSLHETLEGARWFAHSTRRPIELRGWMACRTQSFLCPFLWWEPGCTHFLDLVENYLAPVKASNNSSIRGSW